MKKTFLPLRKKASIDELDKYIKYLGKNISDYEGEGRNTLPFSIESILKKMPGLKSISIEKGPLLHLDDIGTIFSLTTEEATEMVSIDEIRSERWYPINNNQCKRILNGMGNSPINFLHIVHKKDPIRIYKIDELYFIYAGYHRISVARHIGLEKLPAQIEYLSPKKEWSFNMMMNYLEKRLKKISKRGCIAEGIYHLLKIFQDWGEMRNEAGEEYKEIIELT